MLIYAGMLVISVCFALLAVSSPPVRRVVFQKSGRELVFYQQNLLWFCTFLPLFLVSGLRYKIGVDYNSYAWIFKSITQLDQKTHVEIGYEWLNRLVGFFTVDYQFLFLLTTGIFLFFMAKGIRQQSANIPLSVFLFITLGYFFYSMNSIRHFIALSIYFFAIKYMKRQEFWKFLACILIAATFHKIALIAIPLYFVLTRKFKFSYYAIIALLLVVCAVFNRQIMNLIFSFVYQSYKGSVYNVYSFSVFNVLLSGFCTLLCIGYYEPLLKRNPSNIIYINAAFFMLLFYLFCGWIPTPTRIGHYGTILFILLIPEVIACEKNPRIRRFYTVAIIAFGLAFLTVMLIQAQNPSIGLAPYQSVFTRTSL